MARPGTIDYSKWDRLADELSSEEEAPASRAFPAPSPKKARVEDEDDEHSDDYEDASASDSEDRQVHLRTGTCSNCGAANAQKRCSRCQCAWFCDRLCQEAAWPTHAVSCFAKSETEAWWGKLCTPVGLMSADPTSQRDVAVSFQERLEFRRAVAATRERRKAALAAASQAAAARAREGQAKGGDRKGMKGTEEKEETCAVCQCEFTVTGDSGEGICCPSSHFLCSECTGVFVQSILNDLESSYPPKCSMCRAEIPVEAFDRQLNVLQQRLVGEFVAQRSLLASESMMKCECGYMEIRSDRPVLWWCQACQRGECQVCNKQLPPQDDSFALTSCMASSTDSVGSQLDMLLRPHVIGCARLREAKQMVDKAIENGQRMPCPGCGLAGMKDEACTHMSCPRCHASWCYLCGLSDAKCDKASPRPGRPVNDIFLHNTDWETNPLRCPMYLTQVLEIDPAWLGQDWDGGEEVDDDRCLAYFHRWRTIQLLQEVRTQIGASTFEEIWLHFETVRNAGYEIEEIIHTDTSVLIDRDGWQDQDASDESGFYEDDAGSDSDPDVIDV